MQKQTGSKDKRTFHPKEFWAKHIKAQEASGLSKSAYCRKNNLHPVIFSRWRKKLEALNVESSGSFVELKVSNLSNVPINRRIEIITHGGTRVLIDDKTDPYLIRNLIKALEAV